MKRSIGLWQLWGFAVTSLLGTILHYLYDLTGKAVWSALFSGVNESTWEHMKLLFWPMFLYAVFQRFFFRDISAFWCVKLKGILLGLVLIPVIFCTYNGVIGPSPDWVNITIFFLAAAAAYGYETRVLFRGTKKCRFPKLAFTLLCLIGVLFTVFTFAAPELGIFRDPLTGSYGI